MKLKIKRLEPQYKTVEFEYWWLCKACTWDVPCIYGDNNKTTAPTACPKESEGDANWHEVEVIR